jgi:hypothetical protein
MVISASGIAGGNGAVGSQRTSELGIRMGAGCVAAIINRDGGAAGSEHGVIGTVLGIAGFARVDAADGEAAVLDQPDRSGDVSLLVSLVFVRGSR